MILPGTPRLPRFVRLTALSLLAALSLLQPANAQTPAISPGAGQGQPTDPGTMRPLSQDASILSIAGGQRLMSEASQAVSAQNYDMAVKKLQEARQVFNQLSTFYQDLASSFSGIDNRIADTQRRRALETAQMRDQATYQLALVHRALNQPELAVPLLVQIIRSQQPTRDLGQKSYQQLVELGFIEPPATGGAPSGPAVSNK